MLIFLYLVFYVFYHALCLYFNYELALGYCHVFYM